MNQKPSEIPSPSLIKLALTPNEAKCYQILLSRGSLDAGSLARIAQILPNAVYRLVLRLKQKGFIAELDTHPVSFQALPPRIAVESYAQSRLREITELSAQSLHEITAPPSLPPATIELVTGKDSMFAKSAQLISQAAKEVLIISLGEQVPDEIRLADRDAIRRGVTIKFIVHTYTTENKSLLSAWVKMGLEVRYQPGSGYHLQITDSDTCLIAASNPANSEERSAVVIKGKGLSTAMRNYFHTQWKQAVPVPAD